MTNHEQTAPNKQESIEIIEFVVFWKQKKKESIEQIELVTPWKQKKQESIEQI